eukprot:bmy_04991T0
MHRAVAAPTARGGSRAGEHALPRRPPHGAAAARASPALPAARFRAPPHRKLPYMSGEGVGKLASVPAGGAVAVSAAPGAAAPAAGSAPAAAEEKKEEKKEESEESDDDMGFGLFD